MRKKANAPEDLYGPLIECLGSTLRQGMKVIAPAFFILIAVWSLAFGEWRLAALSLILFVYYVYALRTGQLDRPAGERWLDGARRGVTEAPTATLILGATLLVVVGAGYGLSIGFWITLAFWLGMVGLRVARWLRRPPENGT
jgi:hypothetical protein